MASHRSTHRPPTPEVAKPVVVFLDDEPRILSSLARLLRNEPIELLTTDRPEQALEWIRSRPVRIVIADYRMPEMDGVCFLEAVQRISPSSTRLLLTGYPGESLILKSLDRGLLEMIAKPWDNDQLKQVIRRHLPGVPQPQRSGAPQAS